MSNLQLRLLTAAVGIPAIALLAWFGGWPFAIAAGIIAVLAAAEFIHGWLFPSLPIDMVAGQLPVAGVSGLMVAGTYKSPYFVVVGLAFTVLMALMGYSRIVNSGPRKPYRVYAWSFLYTGLLMAAVVAVRVADDGRAWFFLGLLATFAVDTGAYAVGKTFGRHRMAPSISPGKTWEGAAGGFVAGVGAVFALNALFDTGVSLAVIAPVAVGLPVFAMAGDLFESWMKRRMGVKDASGLLPGHGGFLDRLDSILFVFPALFGYLWLFVL
ncbi:MAG TPA: phosphatidate cytidylyltransferase [Tepidiformaceae bacterium]|nr:phosphatidate cytidylyltransferase [Tepidiformaceae bacterium]